MHGAGGPTPGAASDFTRSQRRRKQTRLKCPSGADRASGRNVYGRQHEKRPEHGVKQNAGTVRGPGHRGPRHGLFPLFHAGLVSPLKYMRQHPSSVIAVTFLRFWPRFRGRKGLAGTAPARGSWVSAPPPPQAGTHNHRPVIMGPGSRAIACRKMRARPGRQQRALKRASLAQSPVDVRSRDRLAPVVRIGFGLLFFGRRGAASGAAVAAASACLRAIAARHFAGWTLRSARNWRFSASLNVASYARRARASYRQAKSANTANAIGTTRGIMRQAITVLGLWRTAYRRPCAGESTTAGPAARRRDACPSATRSDGGMP